MAITHRDLEPSRSKIDLRSKTGTFVMGLTILLGILSCSQSLIAEAKRSKVTWMNSGGKEKGDKSECVYNSNGKVPLICAASAFAALGIGIVVEHSYMLIAMSKSPPSNPSNWDLDSSSAKSLKWLAWFLFITTWICFAIAEILLYYGGLIVELGHLKNWSMPRTSCPTVNKGLFFLAGVFCLLSVSLATGLFLTKRSAQRISEERANIRREIIEAPST